MTNIKFPGVTTTIAAKTRRASIYVENPKVPVLFATVVSDKGPYAITKVHNLTEFKEIYGELSYDKQGQDVLNLYQWIGAIPFNGYAWIKRIEPSFVKTYTDETTNKEITTYVEDESTLARAIGTVSSVGEGFTLRFTAKDAGEVFTKFRITVIQRKNSTGDFMPEFNITVRDNLGIVVDNLVGIKSDNVDRMLPLLEYFDVTLSGSGLPEEVSGTPVFIKGAEPVSKVDVSLALEEGSNLSPSGLDRLTPDDIFEAFSIYYRTNARLELEDMLAYPISMILDGNYPTELKYDIIDFVRDVRDDIHFLLTRAKYRTTGTGAAQVLELDIMDEADVNDLLNYELPETGNVAIFAPDFARVNNPAVKGYTTVSSMYELASKIPYNDYNYGIWWNFVGPKRGVTTGELIHTNTIREKEEYYRDLTNYIEKTNRDQCFMPQLTTGTPNTAYVQLHASRLTQYLRKEITWIGRKYIGDYNDIDATTYTDCKNEIRTFLNKFASIAIDMSVPYSLDVKKKNETTFTISLTGLKYKDIVQTVDLYVELE